MSLARFFYDPSDDFSEFFGENGYDRGFGPVFRRRADQNNTGNAITRPFAPKMDIKEIADNRIQATIDLPGLKKENINIDVHNDRVTISGETESSTETTGEGGYSVRERSFGKFTRSLSLPRGTKPEDIKASMENGLLTLTFPKNAAEHAPSRITIN